MTWRPARSIDTLLAEVNAAAPDRSKVSDGIVGDLSHQARPSDHNPNASGVVRAVDITNDPPQVDSSDLAERIRLRALDGHPALGSGAYLISDGRIASATYGWTWRSYTGSNAHTQHCHVSVSTAASGYDSTAPWGVMEESDDMPYSPDELRAIVRGEIDAALSDIGEERVTNPGDEGPGSRSLASILWALLRAQRNTNELLRSATRKAGK